MIVIDASAMLEILRRTEAGQDLEFSLINEDLHSPHVIDLEVLQTLRRWVLSSVISARDAELAVRVFLSLEITRHPHLPYVTAIWSLRHNLTAYDAAYLALAHALGAELVTRDSGLRKMAARKKPN